MDKKECEARKSCEMCEAASTCSDKDKEEQETARLKQKLFRIRHKIMVMSGKGGVGKSTVTTNLAASLALRGWQVGILDADLHGPDVPRMLGVENQHLTAREHTVEPVEVFKGLKAVSMALLGRDPDKAIVWRGPLKHTAIKQFLDKVNWGNLDFLFVDLPPGTGDEPLSVASLIKQVDGSIIVTTPQEIALLDSRKAVDFSRLLQVPVLGIVENMSGMACPHCGESIDLFKIGGGKRSAEELEVPFLGSIPVDPRIVDNCDSGKPLVADSTESEARFAFDVLVQKVLDALDFREKKAVSAVH